MKLSEKQRLFTRYIAHFLQWCYLQGYEITLGEAWRTVEQQARYIKSGRSQTMKSKHLDRLALDINLFVNGAYTADLEAYRPLGEYWESLHPECKWGGSWETFKDAPHFQMF